jgi:hypothetical protein
LKINRGERGCLYLCHSIYLTIAAYFLKYLTDKSQTIVQFVRILLKRLVRKSFL